MGTLFGVYYMKFATDVLLVAPAIVGRFSRRQDFGTLSAIRSSATFLSNPIEIWSPPKLDVFAAVPAGLALVGIWSPPERLDEFQLVIWLAVGLLIYETVQTAYFVPHGSSALN